MLFCSYVKKAWKAKIQQPRAERREERHPGDEPHGNSALKEQKPNHFSAFAPPGARYRIPPFTQGVAPHVALPWAIRYTPFRGKHTNSKTLCATLRLCVTEEKDAIHLRLTQSRKGAQSFVCLFVTHQLFRGTTFLKMRPKNVTISRYQTLLIIGTLDYPKIISNLF